MSALSPKAEARDIELAPTQGRSSCSSVLQALTYIAYKNTQRPPRFGWSLFLRDMFSCLPLTREVDFAEGKRRRERYFLF